MRIRHGGIAVTALRPAHQHLAQPGVVRNLAAEIDIEAEPGAHFFLVGVCHLRSPFAA